VKIALLADLLWVTGNYLRVLRRIGQSLPPIHAKGSVAFDQIINFDLAS
jgi:hypothetical protein